MYNIDKISVTIIGIRTLSSIKKKPEQKLDKFVDVVISGMNNESFSSSCTDQIQNSGFCQIFMKLNEKQRSCNSGFSLSKNSKEFTNQHCPAFCFSMSPVLSMIVQKPVKSREMTQFAAEF